MPDSVADYQEYAARRAHLAVSAVIHLFYTGEIRTVETEELESLHEYASAELQDRQRRRDNDFPEYLEGLPF